MSAMQDTHLSCQQGHSGKTTLPDSDDQYVITDMPRCRHRLYNKLLASNALAGIADAVQ